MQSWSESSHFYNVKTCNLPHVKLSFLNFSVFFPCAWKYIYIIFFSQRSSCSWPVWSTQAAGTSTRSDRSAVSPRGSTASGRVTSGGLTSWPFSESSMLLFSPFWLSSLLPSGQSWITAQHLELSPNVSKIQSAHVYQIFPPICH